MAQQLEAESKSLPDKLQEVTAELQELTRKVGAGGAAWGGARWWHAKRGVCCRVCRPQPQLSCMCAALTLSQRARRTPPPQVEAHGQALAPGPGREMSFEEKRKLSHSMGSLAGERLVHVLQIIADGPSAPVLVRARLAWLGWAAA